MKALYTLVFIACLIATSLFAQDKSVNNRIEISQEEWNDIVDYVNAEVTRFSMVKYKNGGTPIKSEEQIDLDKFNKTLESNSKEEPTPFIEVKNNVELNWNKTFKNISTPIETFKRLCPKIFDSLFFKIEHLESFESLKLNESSEYDDLKNEFLPTQQPEKIERNVDRQESEQAVVVRESNIHRGKKRTLFNYWMIPILLFLVSTIILFIKWKKESKKHNDLKILKDKGCAKRDNSVNTLNNNIIHLNNEITRLNYELEQAKKVKSPNQLNEGKRIFEAEKKSPAIKVVPEPVVKLPRVFYSGKPTAAGKFSPISSSPISGETIYKLYEHEDGLTADFEIALVDQFITREVTNSPDEYLYRVCSQENSNKDFSREIITTKKGLAVLIDGNWVVKEANKATIKFQ
ncbi:hypothetical protein [Maribacter antarcticus]|uniref:hypothetical protein n=1 Tax=Maribacter antarcticus TaxID=505250 RepID=UPI00047BBFC7|nr:hypothetical protein [Maribacter antarcticus]